MPQKNVFHFQVLITKEEVSINFYFPIPFRGGQSHFHELRSGGKKESPRASQATFTHVKAFFTKLIQASVAL